MASKSINSILNLKDNFSKTINKTSKNTQQFQRQMKHASNSAIQMKNKINSAFGGMALRVGGVLAGLGIATFAKDSLMLASDMKEVQNVVDTTFGGMSSKVNEFAKKASTQFGMSGLQAKQFSGTLGAMMKSSGIAGNKLTEMSTNLAGLAGDFASFYNLDPAEAFEKIKAGMVGSTEPLLSLGINMQVASMEAYALSKGIKKSWKEMSEAEKQTLRYNYLLEKSKDAQGDYAKTHAGFANALRTLQLKAKDLGATLMSYTIPTFEKLFDKLIKITDIIAPLIGIGINKLKELWKQFDVSNKINNVKSIFMNVFNNIKNTISEAKKPVTDFIDSVLGFAKVIWEEIKPAIDYIKDNNIISNVFDKVKTSIFGVFDIATKTFNFITDNWSTIKPLITGIAIAWGTYKAVMTTIQVVTGAVTLVQLALNAAMNMNPIGIIITGIGLLIGAGILLYKNWDTIKVKALALWEGIKTAFAPVSEFFNGIWNGIKAGFSGLVNFVIDGINLWLAYILAPLNLLIKAVNLLPNIEVPEISLKIPNIPRFANGTSYFKGGTAQINERGGELVNLPNGSQIIPADKTDRILSKNSGGHTFNFTFINPIGEKEFFEKAGNYIMDKTQLALANM